ncbi:MAG: biotin/lipoyl-binding protein [Lachnospira sp.]|nr:biotin/lipoyl-binding protein [Lachnospira sp.]
MKNYTITVNGTVYDVTVEEGASGAAAAAAPAPAAKKPAAKPAAKKGGAGSIKTTAPMQGKVLRIPVKPGQAVKKGDVLVVLEAMKMENEIQAGQDATVVSVDVAVGDMVETGQVMVTLN